ncbi:MAG: hypothetical protein QM809_03095 [Gordonia sp. (in: high G+C Gram-positive bacteria)]|uniref:hypothetical protein n=1 Tax=Gordonia sp. (in: high G+C Gram-positive bacteria) TaxID=84139 RepID=UPI0039E605F2
MSTPSASAPIAGRHVVRVIANALNLSTPAGLLLAVLGRTRIQQGPDGLFVATGWRLPLPLARAFTVGDVVILRSDSWSERLLRHEARHATQWAWCPLVFLPLYGLASAWSWVRTGDVWSRNVFEVRAGLADGGYREQPLRSERRRRAQQSGTVGDGTRTEL